MSNGLGCNAISNNSLTTGTPQTGVSVSQGPAPQVPNAFHTDLCTYVGGGGSAPGVNGCACPAAGSATGSKELLRRRYLKSDSSKQTVSKLSSAGPSRLNLANGNVVLQLANVTGGPFSPFPILSYNSKSGVVGDYGVGWVGSFNRKITEIDASQVDLTDGAGAVLRYTSKDANGKYLAPGEAENALVKNGDDTWTETRPDSFKFQYSTAGVLDTMENAASAFWTLTHDGGGRLTRIEDPVGDLTTLSYDASNKLEKIIDTASRVTTFTVDGNGDLTKRTCPELCQSEMTYDAQHRMLTHEDGEGNRVTFGYDFSDRVASYDSATGSRTTISYSGSVTQVEDPAGNLSTLQFDGSDQLTKVID